MDVVRFAGLGLHGGTRGGVTFRRRPGPLLFRIENEEVTARQLRVVGTNRSVTVETPGGRRVRTVEHLLAALAGLGIRQGLSVELEGEELPLLDGGAADVTRAIRALGVPRSPPPLRVRERGEIVCDGRRYHCVPRATVLVEVTVEFAGCGRERAHWDGSPATFADAIAPAPTFGFLQEEASLRAAGLAAGVDPDAVLLLDENGRPRGPRRREPDSLARHKLLDLLGDAFLHGGPPLGQLVVERPGHGPTHAFFREALERGLIGS